MLAQDALQRKPAEPSVKKIARDVSVLPVVKNEPHEKKDRQIPFCSLLPYQPDTIVRKKVTVDNFIRTVFFMLQASVEGLNALISQTSLHLFDPHVGETSCQIRAYQLLKLFSKKELRQKCILAKGVLADHLEKVRSKKFSSNKSVKLYISELISFFECGFFLDMDVAFLVVCFILTKYKTSVHGRIVFDYHGLSESLDIVSKHTHRLARHLQKIVSEFSVDHVFDLLHSLRGKAILPAKIFQKLTRFDESQRNMAPCFFVMEAILQSLLCRESINVLVACRASSHFSSEVSVIFQLFQAVAGQFFPVDASKTNHQMPCFVIVGETKYDSEIFLSEFLQIGLQNIILANAAEHPQYSGQRQSCYASDPFGSDENFSIEEKPEVKLLRFRLKKYQSLAQALGCGKHIVGLFSLKHILCDTYQHQRRLAVEDGAKIFSGSSL